jgi:SAM-dependent methyltransferase
MPRTENKLAQASFVYQRRRAAWIQKLLARTVPRPFLRKLKRLMSLPLDGADLLLGRRKALVPPRYLNFAGDGDFEATGDEFFRYLVDFGGLRPEHKVLEVGSGIGRMARPLTMFLTSGGYEGLDIVPEGITWCRKHISSVYSNFRFQLADVYNLMYNPRGQVQAGEYRFPFQDNEFACSFLVSVFTHMRKIEMENYLAEIARILQPGGRCLITFFLLNEESRRLIRQGRSSLNFVFSLDGCWTDDESVPERLIAFDEESIAAIYDRLGLVREPVRYGSWCGRDVYLSYQDIIVARKN